MISSFLHRWWDYLTSPNPITHKGEFIGVFWDEADMLPYLIFETRNIVLPPNQVAYQVGATSSIMIPYPDRELEASVEGWTKRVKVVGTGLGTKLYVGIVAELWFDPTRWEWGDGGGLHTYTTKHG
jgi:hypothetical protein